VATLNKTRLSYIFAKPIILQNLASKHDFFLELSLEFGHFSGRPESPWRQDSKKMSRHGREWMLQPTADGFEAGSNVLGNHFHLHEKFMSATACGGGALVLADTEELVHAHTTSRQEFPKSGPSKVPVTV